MQFDYNYLCQGLGHLTGLETRIYKGDERAHHYSPYDFDPDIAGLITDEVRGRDENAFYIETDDLLVFGIIKAKADDVIIIIGPTSTIRPSRQNAVATLYRLNEPYARMPDLLNYFSNMIPYPFETFLEILCFVNYALNDEKLSVAQLVAENGHLMVTAPDEWQGAAAAGQMDPHNTFQAEQAMLSYVTTGNVKAIHTFFNSPPTGRIGSIAHNELRQRKNTFICAATLISRAAIAGGMASNIAFALSDRYIQKVELLTSGGDITTLNMEMLLDYTQKVEALKCGIESSNIAKSVMRYIQKNIETKISVTDMAKALGLNRSYLCEKFKMDTGNTIGDFVMQLKIDEARRMLKTSNLSIAHISEYLAFSSQSYFQNVFKKLEGCTPKQFRSKVQTEQNMI